MRRSAGVLAAAILLGVVAAGVWGQTAQQELRFRQAKYDAGTAIYQALRDLPLSQGRKLKDYLDGTPLVRAQFRESMIQEAWLVGEPAFDAAGHCTVTTQVTLAQLIDLLIKLHIQLYDGLAYDRTDFYYLGAAGQHMWLAQGTSRLAGGQLLPLQPIAAGQAQQVLTAVCAHRLGDLSRARITRYTRRIGAEEMYYHFYQRDRQALLGETTLKVEESILAALSAQTGEYVRAESVIVRVPPETELPAPPPPPVVPIPVPPPVPIGPSGTANFVVTNVSALTAKYDQATTTKVLNHLRQIGDVHDVSGTSQQIDGYIEAHFKMDRHKRILIFGNDDVIPFCRIANPHSEEYDKTLLWDDPYADFDHDAMQVLEVFICRIPDDRKIIDDPGSTLWRAHPPGDRLQYTHLKGLANYRRPFCDDLTALWGAKTDCLWSEPTTAGKLPWNHFANRNVFMLLHGSDTNGKAFTGETTGGGYPIAFTTEQANLPDQLIVCGACYGSYTVGKTSDTSIVMRALAKGCRGFVGATASTYSEPGDAPVPMSSLDALFFKTLFTKLAAGVPPEAAYLQTKQENARAIAGQGKFKEVAHKNWIIFQYFGLPPVTPAAPNPTGPSGAGPQF